MSNVELTKHFLQMQYDDTIQFCSYQNNDNIIDVLNSIFKHNWAWNIVDECFILDKTTVSTTVHLFIPGRVLTGRAISKIANYEINHIKAIKNAYSMLCNNYITAKENNNANDNHSITSSQTQEPTTSTILLNNDTKKPNLEHSQHNDGSNTNKSKDMTPDEIMSIVNNAQQNNTSSLQSNSIQSSTDDLPFYFSENIDLPNRDNSINNIDVDCQQPYVLNDSQPSQSQQVQDDYHSPKQSLNGFSQYQVDQINEFKKKFEIINDTMFGNYINLWNDNFTRKDQLTPQNIDDFIKWGNQLGE